MEGRGELEDRFFEGFSCGSAGVVVVVGLYHYFVEVLDYVSYLCWSGVSAWIDGRMDKDICIDIEEDLLDTTL